MNLLLDTQVLLRALADDQEPVAEARVAIIDPANRVVVIAVSAWGIVIKANLGRLRAPDDRLDQVRQAGFEPLPVTLEHALVVGDSRIPTPIHSIGYSSPRVARSNSPSSPATPGSASTT